MEKDHIKIVQLLTISLIFFKTVANTIIASNVPIENRELERESKWESAAKRFVSLVCGVSEEDIGVQKAKYGRSGYVAIVYIWNTPQWVFKSETNRREIECSKKFSSLDDMLDFLSLVGVSHFTTPDELENGKFQIVASVSEDQIIALPKERYLSLQPCVEAAVGSTFLDKMIRDAEEGSNSFETYSPLVEKIGKAISYMHSKEIYHNDFNSGNWLYNEKTGKVYVIDWASCLALGDGSEPEEPKLPWEGGIWKFTMGLLDVATKCGIPGWSLGLMKLFLGCAIGEDKCLLDKFKERFRGFDVPSFLENRCILNDGSDEDFFKIVCLGKVYWLLRNTLVRIKQESIEKTVPIRDIIEQKSIEEIIECTKRVANQNKEPPEQIDAYKEVLEAVDRGRLNQIFLNRGETFTEALLSKICN
jgi:hypothetical protein